MNRSTNPYERHRFPPAIIRYAVWLYYRFNLSHRDIEDLLAERGIEASYESVRLWCNKFGPLFSKRLKHRHPGFGDTFFIDEVFVTIAGRRHYLWRAVDQGGDVVDVYLQTRRNAEAAKRFFRRLIRSHGTSPRKIVTDKLGSYGVASLQLAEAGAAVPERPRRRLQPVQPAAPAGVGGVLQVSPGPCVRMLERSC